MGQRLTSHSIEIPDFEWIMGKVSALMRWFEKTKMPPRRWNVFSWSKTSCWCHFDEPASVAGCCAFHTFELTTLEWSVCHDILLNSKEWFWMWFHHSTMNCCWDWCLFEWFVIWVFCDNGCLGTDAMHSSPLLLHASGMAREIVTTRCGDMLGSQGRIFFRKQEIPSGGEREAFSRMELTSLFFLLSCHFMLWKVLRDLLWWQSAWSDSFRFIFYFFVPREI